MESSFEKMLKVLGLKFGFMVCSCTSQPTYSNVKRYLTLPLVPTTASFVFAEGGIDDLILLGIRGSRAWSWERK